MRPRGRSAGRPAGLLVVGAALAAASCGDAMPAMVAPPVGSPEELTARLAPLVCANEVKCGIVAVSERNACVHELASTRASYAPAYSPDEAVAAGRLVFDGRAALACLSGWAALGCTIDQYDEVVARCARAYRGAVLDGGTCFAAVECETGYCDQKTAKSGCGGICRAFTATGQACGVKGTRCRAADFCDPGTKRCTTRLVLGASCAPGQCADPLSCKGYRPKSGNVPETRGVCAGRGRVGDVCVLAKDGTTDCALGLYCSQDTSPRLCAARGGLGAECTGDSQCDDALACVGIVYDGNSVIVRAGGCAPWADVGAACDPAQSDACPYPTTRCGVASKSCVAVGEAGSDCSSSLAGSEGYCREYLYCDSATNRCTAKAAFNSSCVPPATTSGGQPGLDPCDQGAAQSPVSCDAASKTCTLHCM